MSQRLLVQSALRGAQGIEHKNRNIDPKALAILSYTKKAAVHGARGGAQMATAGVLELLARLQQRQCRPRVVHGVASGNVGVGHAGLAAPVGGKGAPQGFPPRG